MSASLSDLASTSTIFAFGATACDHWTSRVISPAQPVMSSLPKSNAGTPCGAIVLKTGSGRPNVWSKIARSDSTYGFENASMITIVRFRPVIPLSSSDWMP